MAKFRRALIEIGNECNLRCYFCAKSRRSKVIMPVEKFEFAAKQVNEFAKVISLHLLGEPLLHPDFPEIIVVAEKLGLSLNLVTNGTLAASYGDEVWGKKCFRQVTFSAQSLSCFAPEKQKEKIAEYVEFAKRNCRRFKVSFRLRGDLGSSFVRSIAGQFMMAFGHFSNGGGQDKPLEWNGQPFTLAERIFLNHGEIFSWRGGRPQQAPCLGLRHHFGILSDGTVVPCCADYDGAMAIGNIFKTPLAEILLSPKTLALRRAIEGKEGPMPEYCKGCGFIMP